MFNSPESVIIYVVSIGAALLLGNMWGSLNTEHKKTD